MHQQQDTIVRAIADQFAGRDCYLDGAPARVVGRLNRFATVRSDHGSVEYSWHTVNRVMRDRAGYFETR